MLLFVLVTVETIKSIDMKFPGSALASCCGRRGGGGGGRWAFPGPEGRGGWPTSSEGTDKCHVAA